MSRSELRGVLLPMLSLLFLEFGCLWIPVCGEVQAPRSARKQTWIHSGASVLLSGQGRGLLLLSVGKVGGMALTYGPILDLLCKNSLDINKSLKQFRPCLKTAQTVMRGE